MKKYESLLIFKASISKEALDAIATELVSAIETNKGSVIKHESLGVKELATEIKHKKEGHFYLIQFESDTKTLDALEAIFKVTEDLMRHIIVDYYSVYAKESLNG